MVPHIDKRILDGGLLVALNIDLLDWTLERAGIVRDLADLGGGIGHGKIISGLAGREYAGYRIGVPAFHIGCALGDGRIPQEKLAALDRVADAIRSRREDGDDERRGEPGEL